MSKTTTPKLTPALIPKIGEMLFLAFTDAQIAFYLGVTEKTFISWRKLELFARAKRLEIELEIPFRQKIWAAKGYWQGAAWFLERKYPTQFAKPEIQLSLNNSFTQNNLSITISGDEAKAIEADANPVRASVKAMFDKYRPNGNGHS